MRRKELEGKREQNSQANKDRNSPKFPFRYLLKATLPAPLKDRQRLRNRATDLRRAVTERLA